MNWRDKLDPRQQKEVQLAELYQQQFNHGTTGHNALVLIAHLAQLLDEATGLVPVQPKDATGVRLTFGKYSGKLLSEVFQIDPTYVGWLTTAARDATILQAARDLMASSVPQEEEFSATTEDIPF